MARIRTIILASSTIFFACFLLLTLSFKDSAEDVSEKEALFFESHTATPQVNTNTNQVHQPQGAQPANHQVHQEAQPANHQVHQPQENEPSSQGGQPAGRQQGERLAFIDRLPSIAPTEDIILDGDLWIPAGWSGLPLSFENPLYFDPNVPEVVQHRQELVDILKTKNLKEWQDDAGWNELLYEFENLIGWNGIFDAVGQAQTELGFDVVSRVHALGEILANSTLLTKKRYLVEITSRDILHKAPMHGGVWSIVQVLLTNYVANKNISTLFDTIDEELCFFKNEDNMGNIWISCVHGVGHGLANFFGVEQISDGLEICSKHPDEQYRYACATGIFMSLEPNYSVKSFAPCDSNRFAPACYRFKSRLFNQLFYNTSDPCFSQPTPYHKRGCIWGYAYTKYSRSRDVYSVCEPFKPENPTDQPGANDYAACFDGFMGSHEIMNLPERARAGFCDNLQPYESAHNICTYYLNTTLRRFTFGSGDDEVYFYNYDLLEELFDPSLLGKSATWMPQWNLIIPQREKVSPPVPAQHAHQN